MESQSLTEVLNEPTPMTDTEASEPQPKTTEPALAAEEPTLENGGLGEGVLEPALAAAPEQLTRKQLGQLRRQWITQTNGTVKKCGHKDNFSTIPNKREGKQPNNNCVYCWEAYFVTSVDLDLVHTVLTTKGGKALVAMKGTKFVRMFHGFLSTKMLPMLAAEINKAPATIVGGTFGANEDAEVSPVGSAEHTTG